MSAEKEKILFRASIQKEREALRKRLADLDTAERVLDTMGETLPVRAETTSPTNPMPSIKKIILKESSRPTGASAAEIAAVISAWIPNYPVKNVSPKLSLYGSEGFIFHDSGRWTITHDGLKELARTKD